MNSILTQERDPGRKLETVSCDLCKSSDQRLKFTATNPEFGEPFNLVECGRCGLVYLSPRPAKEEIGRYYPEEDYYAYQDFDSRDWNNLRRKAKSFILECQPGYAKNLRLARKIVWSVFKRSLMTQVPHQTGGRVLDVGCGNGYFLKWMQKHGWEALGVDISKSACRVAEKNGITVFNGQLTEAKHPSNYFDVVTMDQVLEHVHSPAENIREIHRILKPGGLLVVCVPNLQSFEERIFRENWYALDVPRHLYFFDISRLQTLLQKQRFHVEQILSKSFGLRGHGLKASFDILRANNLKHLSPRQIAGLKLRYLFFYWVARPYSYLMTSKKKEFGVYISFYARKK